VVENGQIVIRPMNYLAVSYDHRIIDGREAVQFLSTIKEALEFPAGCCWTCNGVPSVLSVARFCAKSKHEWQSQNKTAGVARQLVTFSCFAKEKVTKRRRPGFRRCAVPFCRARTVRRLRNSRYALRQSSPTPPDPLRYSAAHRDEKRKVKRNRVGNELPTKLKWIGKTIRPRYIGNPRPLTIPLSTLSTLSTMGAQTEHSEH